MSRYILNSLIFFCIAFPVLAQAQDLGAAPIISFTTEEERQAEKEGYFHLYNDGWTIRPNMGFKQFSFSIENTDTGRKLEYVPNVGFGIGCKFVYKAFGLGFTIAIPTAEDDTKGDSRYQDLQFTFPMGKHGIDFTYQNYQGFYVNDEALKPFNGGDYKKYPDMAGALIELRYYYAFNSNFSMKAAFNQTARQLQDAGSWLVSTSLNTFIVSQGGGFIPAFYAADFGTISTLDAMVSTGVSVSGGYIYTWVWENGWFFSPSLMLGLNYEHQIYYIAGDEIPQDVPFNPKTSIKLSVGKHVDKYYFGASLVQNMLVAVATENISFAAQTLNINFYYGIRL